MNSDTAYLIEFNATSQLIALQTYSLKKAPSKPVHVTNIKGKKHE